MPLVTSPVFSLSVKWAKEISLMILNPGTQWTTTVVTLLISTSLVIIVTLEQQEVPKLYGGLWYDDPRYLVNYFTLGLICALFAIGVSFYCLFGNALHSMGAFHLCALYITENWGLVTLWCGKRLATAAINLFGNLGDYRVHWNRSSLLVSKGQSGSQKRRAALGKLQGCSPCQRRDWIDWSWRSFLLIK